MIWYKKSSPCGDLDVPDDSPSQRDGCPVSRRTKLRLNDASSIPTPPSSSANTPELEPTTRNSHRVNPNETVAVADWDSHIRNRAQEARPIGLGIEVRRKDPEPESIQMDAMEARMLESQRHEKHKRRSAAANQCQGHCCLDKRERRAKKETRRIDRDVPRSVRRAERESSREATENNRRAREASRDAKQAERREKRGRRTQHPTHAEHVMVEGSSRSQQRDSSPLSRDSRREAARAARREKRRAKREAQKLEETSAADCRAALLQAARQREDIQNQIKVHRLGELDALRRTLEHKLNLESRGEGIDEVAQVEPTITQEGSSSQLQQETATAQPERVSDTTLPVQAHDRGNAEERALRYVRAAERDRQRILLGSPQDIYHTRIQPPPRDEYSTVDEDIPPYRAQLHKYLDLVSYDERFTPILRVNRYLVNGDTELTAAITKFSQFNLLPQRTDLWSISHVDDNDYEEMIPVLIPEHSYYTNELEGF